MKERYRKILDKIGDEWHSYLIECEAFGDKPEYTEDEFRTNRLLQKIVFLPPHDIGDGVFVITDKSYYTAVVVSIHWNKNRFGSYFTFDVRLDGEIVTVQEKFIFASEAEAKYALKNRRSVSLVNGHIEE